MLVLYLPPHRESSDAEAEATCARALEDYLEDLVEYPSDVLQAGWKQIRRTHKRLGWPLISEIRSACQDQLRGAERASRPKENVFQTLQRRATEIDRMTRQYTDATMLGEIGQEARSEGWAGDLRDYVRREAHLQAQRIVRTGQGVIEVIVPPDLMDEWKKHA